MTSRKKSIKGKVVAYINLITPGKDDPEKYIHLVSVPEPGGEVNPMKDKDKQAVSEMLGVGRGTYFNTVHFNRMEAECLDKIPHNVDGFKLHQIKTTNAAWAKMADILSGGHQCHKGFNGKRKSWSCTGLFVCPNTICYF